LNKKKIIIFKNDAVGDLVQSLDAINNIANHDKNTKITIYLSERSKNFKFLLNFKNTEIKILNYDLKLIDKIKILIELIKGSFKSAYILSPKTFYYYLPILFRKIKFYGLCINNVNNYKRPLSFLRKYLYFLVINERDKINKRESTSELQVELTKDLNFKQKYKINLPSEIQNNNDFKIVNYIYFHLKFSNFKKLGWGLSELDLILNEFLKYKQNVIFTKDIELSNQNHNYEKNYNVIDFFNNTKKINKSRIYLYDNIKGIKLYKLIRNADKVVGFHGMMTNLASIEKRPVLDLFYCDIKSREDFRRYKNALYEFKPKYKGYDFIVPNKNINKTISKMKFSLKKTL
tara:strand:- start:692 stop:1729 length:1038 start_codon:yes stop_codon:yes gene_type:complete